MAKSALKQNAPPIETAETSENWNPFSLKRGLSSSAFLITLIMVGFVELTVAFMIQIPMHSARLSLDFKQLGVLYFAWVAFSVLGFFFVVNAFIKRWARIYGLASVPWWMKSAARFLLLSPLLSLWATLLTILFAKNGVLLKDGEIKTTIFAVAITTFALFHVGFLGWSISQNHVRIEKGVFHLVDEVSPRRSLRESLPGTAAELWLPDERFQVHVYPYLSPLLKLGVSIYGDFSRSRTLALAIERAPGNVCTDITFYEGQPVPNCFLTEYQKIASRRGFVSPAFAILYESLYRERMTKQHPTAMSPMESVALNTVSIENIVTLLEPSKLNFDRQQFTRPIGLLAVYGSPELPAISVGQDLQHQLLATKFLPTITSQILKISNGLAQARNSLSPQEDARAHEKLSSISQRLKVLAEDPLATHAK